MILNAQGVAAALLCSMTAFGKPGNKVNCNAQLFMPICYLGETAKKTVKLVISIAQIYIILPIAIRSKFNNFFLPH